jgi:hypothetical protein
MALRTLSRRTQELEIATDTPAEDTEAHREHTENQVRLAMAIPAGWLLKHTKTYNEHWADEGMASPEEPFPDYPYLHYTLEVLSDPEEKVICIEKSRDMMASWLCVGFFTYMAQKRPRTQCVFQSQEEEKAFQLIDYAKQLWRSQPQYLRDAYPLTRDVDDFAKGELAFLHGSELFAIAGGANKLRSYHPWGYLNDETTFQAEAGKSYANALAACNKIVLNSSAGSAWYADFRNDVNV